MVVLVVEELEGRDWWGVSADGYVPDASALLPIHVREFPARVGLAPELSPQELFGSIAGARFPVYYRETFGEAVDIDRSALFQLRYDVDEPVTPPYSRLYQELLWDHDRDSYTHLVMIKAGGERTDACMRALLDPLGFTVRPEERYADYEQFRVKAQAVVGQILAPFAFPRGAARENLMRLNLDSRFY